MAKCIDKYIFRNTSGINFYGVFSNCYSLREVPTWFKKIKIKNYTYATPTANNCGFQNTFLNCYALDEATDLPIVFKNPNHTVTENLFFNAFTNAGRLKRLTFETPTNGAPVYTLPWQNQTIDLTSTGWIKEEYEADFLKYSNITSNKKITSINTNNQLKNDPDQYTCNSSYSRFNRASAVELFNSLPDTKQYATSSAPNTIKLLNGAGIYTDGGAMKNLTSSEIAIATSKGWTVTFQRS